MLEPNPGTRSAGTSDRSSLEARLRNTSRTLESDRLIMARKIGEIACELDPDNPLRAIRKLFEQIEWQSKWDKRKRLVLLPDDDKPAAQLQASGDTWRRLINAAADASTSKSCLDGDRAARTDRMFRRVLAGTSFLPIAPELKGTGQTLAEDFLPALIHSVLEPVTRQTALVDLWRVAGNTVIRLATEGRLDSQDSTAFLVDADAIGFRAANVSGERCFLTNKSDGYDEWEFPSVLLGRVTRNINTRIFVLPHHIRSKFDGWGLEEMQHEPIDGARSESGDFETRQWLQSELRNRSVSYDDWVENSYFDLNGYGWTNGWFAANYNLNLSIRPRDNGQAGLWLEATHCWEETLQPSRDLHPNKAWRKGGHYVERGALDGFRHSGHVALTWVSGDEAKGGKETYCVGYVDGELDFQVPGGWLDDWFTGQLDSTLTCLGGGASFHSKIPINPEVPDVYWKHTPLGVLFGNAAAANSDRVSNVLLRYAQQISDVGHAFLERMKQDYIAAAGLKPV